MKIFLLILFLTVCLGMRDARAQADATSSPTPEAAASSPAPSEAPAAPALTGGTPETAASPGSAPVEVPDASPAVSPTATDAAPPDQTELPSTPSTGEEAAEPPAADATFTEPSSFVPENVIPTTPEAEPGLPKVKDNEAEKLRMDRLHYRKAKTTALKDPAIRNMLDQADVAATDEDRRAAFRKYYEMLGKKIVQIDSTLVEYAKLMEGAQLHRLRQDNLEPTIPLNPPPTPIPSN